METGIDEILKEAGQIWPNAVLSSRREEERRQVRRFAVACAGSYQKEYADACECFFLFRVIHRMTDVDAGWSALTGDWFFSRFSKALIPIDSVLLIDRFSEYLTEDLMRSEQVFDMEGYMRFIRKTAEEIRL